MTPRYNMGLHLLRITYAVFLAAVLPMAMPMAAPQSIGMEALWRHPIIGSGATSGEQFAATRYRKFSAGVLPTGLKPASPDPQQEKCSHWIVITTINAASANLQNLAGMPDWCKCFVLDRKSPPDFQANGPGMVVLTVAAQEKLKWAVADRMPWNHFGRKNLGFVYAALHGAEYIYDTDDDNFVLDGDARFLPRSLTPPAPDGPEGVQVHWPAGTGARVFNPYPFWGVDAWPRGFPLTMITNETTRSGALPVTAADAPQLPPRVCVLQSLANADPDVDAVHRLTGRLPLFFAPRRAWLAYPAGTYAPFNAQATLFDARALAAALALPVTVHGRVSDIWRSYIMQRAMWDMGCGLAFADPWVTQYRNAHKYLRDFQSELDLYLKTEGLLEVLGRVAFPDWTFASPGAELGGRVLALYVALYEHGLMEADDVVMLHAFLTDLGLMQPAVVDFALRVNRHAAEAAAAAKGAPGAPAAPQGTAMQPQQQPQLPAPKHRAAVCVTGVFRAGPFTLPHYQRNVLSRLGMPYDVFVSTPDLPDAFPHPSDYAYFLQPYKVVHANYSSTDELLALPGWERTEFSGDHYPSKWLGQLTDLSTCRDAIVASGAAYTHVVRLRADAVLAEPLPVPLRSLQPNELVVPDNEQWRGHNDRFAYGGFSSMVAYLSVVDSVAGLLERKQLTNAESALKSHLEAHGVTVLERPMHVCRLRNYAGGRLSCTGWDYITYEPCKSLCDAWHADVAPVQGGEAPPPSKRTWLSRMPLIGSLIILVIGVSCGAKHVWAPRFASRTQ